MSTTSQPLHLRRAARCPGPPLAFLNTKWGRDEAAGLHPAGRSRRSRFDNTRIASSRPRSRRSPGPVAGSLARSPAPVATAHPFPLRSRKLKRQAKYAPPPKAEVDWYAALPLPPLPTKRRAKPLLRNIQDIMAFRSLSETEEEARVIRASSIASGRNKP